MTLSILVLAAVTSLSSADKYVFARPAISNAIRGVVMGDGMDYTTMRYEDIAWLDEALAERRAFVQNISTNIFSTNATLNLTSPVIVRRSFDTGSLGFVDPSCEPSTSDRKIYVLDSDNPQPAQTNIQVRPFRYQDTNTYHFATNYYRQTMTNGTVNVWTNRVDEGYYTNLWYVANQSVTGLYNYVDFCFRTNAVNAFDTITKGSESVALRDLYSVSPLTNLYHIARCLRIPLPYKATLTLDNTNVQANATYKEWHQREGEEPEEPEETRTTSRVYRCSVSSQRIFSAASYRFSKEDEWINDDPTSTHDLSKTMLDIEDRIEYAAINKQSIFATYKSSYGSRIKSARAFAVVYIEYTCSQGRFESGAVDFSTNRTVYAEIMHPLGNVEIKLDGDWVSFECPLGKAALMSAVNCVGLPWIDFEYDQHMAPQIGPAARWIVSEDNLFRTKNAGSYYTESLEAYVTEYYILLELKPNTILDHWSEY